MTNYARIARNDDETFSDEAEFVARRRDELVREWRNDVCKVADAISGALADDYIGTITSKLAAFMVGITKDSDIDADGEVSGPFWFFMDNLITNRLFFEAETAAQAEYDNRLTGPEGDL